MKQLLKYTGYILLLALTAFLLWRFSYIIVWIMIAAVISFVGHPLVRMFDGLHFKKWHIPHSVSTFLSLLIIILVFAGLLGIFVPLIVNQAQTISQIDVKVLAKNLEGPLQWLDDEVHAFGMVPEDQSLQDFIVIKAKSIVNPTNISSLLNSFFGVAGTLLVGFFSVLFIAFFFMKDESMFENSLLLIIPVKHHKATKRVITDSKNLLMRYFIGVLLEVLGVMSIISLGLWILGVKNALLIGFFGGLMNIIPYLGPVIGTLIGLSLGITGTLAAGAYNELLPVLAKLAGVFLTANFVDNNILVPLIYSKSVKAHPLEIFFVIIMGGSLAGLPGMLLAIPVYTVLRVIAREFLQQFRVVRKLTNQIDET
jgi:predicted PurR-regulated permease PerM